MATIRVLQLISSTGFYGAERWILALARNLDRGIVSCSLATPGEAGQSNELDHRFQEIGLPVYRCRMRGRFDPLVILDLLRLIRTARIDIVHTHGYKSDILGLIAARLGGARCVATPHGYGDCQDAKTRFYIRLSFAALRRFDYVTPISEGLHSEICRIGVKPVSVRLILNGLDLTEIDAARSHAGTRDRRNHRPRSIAHLGRLIERKNVAELMRAFDLLCHSRSDVRLLLIGDGPALPRLEALAQSLSCSSRINFLGYRNDRLEVLREVDLIAMTSSSEGIPRCLMEAMAMEIPVVAFSIPGVDRLILHEQTGLLAPFGEVESLKNCFDRILSDDAFARQLASNARNHIEQNFSAHRMAREFSELYAALIAR